MAQRNIDGFLTHRTGISVNIDYLDLLCYLRFHSIVEDSQIMTHTNNMFELDHRLDEDSEFIADWGVFSIHLMKDERFFWLLIIPQLPDVTEWHDLSAEQIKALNKLMLYLSKNIKRIDKADKINIGVLGNIVSQFHLHLVARHHEDAAWPGPVWGAGDALPLLANTQHFRKKTVRQLLADFSICP